MLNAGGPSSPDPAPPNGLVAGLHYLVKDHHVSDAHAPVIAIQ
jgi:hypothetical protein